MRILSYSVLHSTNSHALHLAQAGAKGPLWVVADQQTSGRGQRDKIWISPPGNLYASLLLINPAPLACLSQLGFLASTALIMAVRQLVPDDPHLTLKWPNDLLYDGAKLAGILIETIPITPDQTACVIGWGVNCAHHPSDLPYPATHLARISARDPNPRHLLTHLMMQMEQILELWQGGAQFDPIRRLWLANTNMLGHSITLCDATRVQHGIFHDLDHIGRLVLRDPLHNTLHHIHSGIVT